jgi:ribosome recycling factor
MLEELSLKLTSTLDGLQSDLSGLRAGRASASLVENLVADVYGSPMQIKAIASIMVPDSKSLAIQPWDKANLAPIEKAIRDSELSLNPMNDGIMVRINIPPLSEERRAELIKLVGQKAEAAKIAIRNIRHDAVSKIDADLKAKAIGEDDHKRLEKQIQDKVTEYNGRVDEQFAAKETELKTI